MNLRTRSIYLITIILFLSLSINTAVLTYLAYKRIKKAVISKIILAGEAVSNDIKKVEALGLSIEKIEGLNENLADITLDDTIDYAMILDTEGKIILHSNEEHIGKVFKDQVTVKALASQETVTQRCGDFYDISLPLFDAEEKKVGILRIGASSIVIKKELYHLLLWALTLSLIGCLLFAAVIYFIVSRYITEPIVCIEKIVRKISTGDMTEKVKVTGKGEIALLSDTINNMSTNLRDMIFKIKSLASSVSAINASMTESPASVLRVIDLQKNAIKEHTRHIEEMKASMSSIANSSESLYKSSQEETNALEEINESVSQIAKSAQTFYINALEATASVEEMMISIKDTAGIIEILSASAEESATSLKEVNATISEIQKNAEESVQLAEKVTLDASEKGLTSLNTAIKGIEDIKKSVNAISETINRLERRSEEIGSILHVIDEVAAQTNLLSLNAAILATQAGEHGKSFGVVADEIKRLAEKTSASTKEIAELINTVRAETQSSVEITSKGIASVERGIRLIKEVDNALYGILESSRAATEMSKSIQRATAEEAYAINQITSSIKQTTDKIELISRTTKEQSRGSNIIVEASEKILTGAEQLKSATEWQSKNIKHISYISENVLGQAKQIHVAVNNQKQMNNENVDAIEKIQKTTAELIISATEMVRGIKSLSNDVKILLTEIQQFNV